MSGNVKEFNDSNFQAEVLNSKEPVLVDFWAPWCGPCRQIAPMIEDLANENRGAIKVGKVNIDDNQSLAGEYDVNSIPTLMIFRNGVRTDTFVGTRPKSVLQEALDAAKG